MPVLSYYGSPIQPKIPVKRVQVPISSLKVGRKGSIYDVELRVSDVTPEKARAVVDALSRGLRENFGIRPIYISVTEDRIFMEVQGSPFSWLALLTWLPIILSVVGITLVGISVYEVIASVPSWLIGTLVIGAGLIIFGPIIGEFILREVEKIKR